MIDNTNVGGIEFADIIRFQLKVMFGSQYDKVIKAKAENELIEVCIRIAWNDAFRHVTKNRENTKANAEKEICSIIERITEKFKAYINEGYDNKAEYIEHIIKKEKFLNEFESVKIVDDAERPLCFGHIQKLFNMAAKYYLCLYFCRGFIGKTDEFFDKQMIKGLETAHCPIDSIILNSLGDNQIKWSRIPDSTRYMEIQKKVPGKLKEKKRQGSNLLYDFIAWNNESEDELNMR